MDHTIMNYFLNYITALLLTISFLSCTETAPPPGPHRWQETTIGFYLNKEANLLTETVVREGFQNWGEKTHFTFVFKGRNRAGLKKDGKNTVSFLIKWPDEIPINKTAYCKTWYDRKGNIIESDIIFNMQVARFTTLRTNKRDSYYIEGVLAHEIGHLIGLDHIENETCLMKKFSPITESYFKGNIDAQTIDAYKKLYGIQQ
ncbi:MAG TPA: matrixin family metalloprotease, partial [Spirochaetota bacterium]|nr:matrixin family metalloprotease [Spirochaetota bacterium]